MPPEQVFLLSSFLELHLDSVPRETNEKNIIEQKVIAAKERNLKGNVCLYAYIQEHNSRNVVAAITMGWKLI